MNKLRNSTSTAAVLSTVSLLTLLVPATVLAADGPSDEDLRSPPAAAVHSPSGLVSQVLRPGDGDYRPDANDMVVVSYTGWTPAGAEFTSSRQFKNGLHTFNLQQTFPGWTEGIRLMVLNETRRLWIPAELAPQKPAEGPRGSVIFDVELKGILRLPNAPADPTEIPATAVRTESGASTLILEPGKGETKATAGGVLISYTGWTADGKTFDSSAPRQRPTLFLLEAVMPAFAECLQTMVEGESRRFWIPAHLNDGSWTNNPQGLLVFDVEMVKIGNS